MPANGMWPLSSLAAIPGGTKYGGTAYVRKDLLPSVVGLQAAFYKRFGKRLRPTSANDGYRSYAAQVRVFLQRYTPAKTGYGPFYDVRTWNEVRYIRVTGASAAVPGTSNHGKAEAIDWADIGSKEWSWLMENAPQFGWVNPLWARDANPSNGSREPWHWEGNIVPVSNWKQYLDKHDIVVPDLNLPDELDEDMPLSEDDLDKIARKVWTFETAGTKGNAWEHQREAVRADDVIELNRPAAEILGTERQSWGGAMQTASAFALEATREAKRGNARILAAIGAQGKDLAAEVVSALSDDISDAVRDALGATPSVDVEAITTSVLNGLYARLSPTE